MGACFGYLGSKSESVSTTKIAATCVYISRELQSTSRKGVDNQRGGSRKFKGQRDGSEFKEIYSNEIIAHARRGHETRAHSMLTWMGATPVAVECVSDSLTTTVLDICVYVCLKRILQVTL